MSRRRLVYAVLSVAALVAVVLLVRMLVSGGNAQAKEAGRQGPPAVQVMVAAADKRDIPIWLDGLGSVVPWQQVTVKPQVDGILAQIAFREGQAVKAGDLLATLDPRPFEVQLHQAEGVLARDSAVVKNGRVNLERYRKLVEQKLIAAQQADDQAATVAQAEGALRADQAAVEAARLNLSYATIRSPCDGVVGVKLVDPGNMVRASDANGLVVVTQLDPAGIIVTIPQDDLPQVMQALARGQVPVETWSRDGGQKLGAGTLYAVDNQINAATGTVRVKAQLPNPQHLLWPNAFVKARLLVDTMKSALVVPAPAIQRGPQGTFVYVAQKDGTAAQRPVTVALTTGELAVLGGGVEAGEQVVVEGQNQLRPGSKITVKNPVQAAR